MRVTLSKAVRLPGQPLRPRGYVLEVDEARAEELDELGLVLHAQTVEHPAVVELGEDRAAEVPAQSESDAPRPAKSDPVAKWQDYARSLGIDPKGMTKQELIAKFS